MPAWVKQVLDQWLQAADINSGKLFRRVHKMGKAWGEKLTEKAVWHVVREYAAKSNIDKLAPHDLRRTCARLAMLPEVNSNKFNFCSVTFRFRQPSDISVANSGFKVL
jgi:integrase